MSRSISPTRKFVYSIALIPIIPAVSYVFVTAVAPSTIAAPFDGIRWFQFAFSTLCVLGAIRIWRELVLWTLGRVWLTALISMIPFVQVAVNAPILSKSPARGCSIMDCSGEVLRIGQHQIGIGVWIWATIWCWWGWEKRVEIVAHGTSIVKSLGISTVAKRILLSVGTIPVVVGVFAIASIVLDRVFRPLNTIWFSFAVTAAVQVPMWIAIWKWGIPWDRKTVRRTAILVFCCVVFPIGMKASFDLTKNNTSTSIGEIVTCLVMIGWGLWMALSVWMWPGSAFEGGLAADALKCLKCGYLLTGLRATRCPECGNEPTLDELWNAHISGV